MCRNFSIVILLIEFDERKAFSLMVRVRKKPEHDH
jgi:hypothetical protein